MGNFLNFRLKLWQGGRKWLTWISVEFFFEFLCDSLLWQVTSRLMWKLFKNVCDSLSKSMLQLVKVSWDNLPKFYVAARLNFVWKSVINASASLSNIYVTTYQTPIWLSFKDIFVKTETRGSCSHLSHPVISSEWKKNEATSNFWNKVVNFYALSFNYELQL